MNNDIEYSLPQASIPDPRWNLSYLVGRVLAKGTAFIWRWGNDQKAVVSFVGRYSAHAAVLVLALLVSMFGRLAITPVSIASIAEHDSVTTSSQVVAEVLATPTQPVEIGPASWELSSQRSRAVFRQAQPHTNIPERVRLEVITYTIQSGDNIFSIAQRFKLSPYSVVWANMEPLQGAPWLIQPGLTLYIPPVDGAYHTVMAGDTIESIAESYKVTAADIYNQWNPIEPGQTLREGTALIIPGGVGGEIEWEPPPPPPSRPAVASASGSWGACGNVAVSGPGANGWFILPTGSPAISGWVFRDARNPRHIGIDYRCRMGDPIYAADNGVVVFAGWSGGYGNLVIIDHGNGYRTRYAHFNAFAVGCGQPVRQGTVIGYCGTTGWSTGPHLHYEIRLNGVPQNPQRYAP